jgi:hypothetical protein
MSICEELAVDFGLRVKFTEQDARQYAEIFKNDPEVLHECAICKSTVEEGDFSLETMKSNDDGIKYKRPRICCSECAEVHAWKMGKKRTLTKHIFPVMKVFFTLNNQIRELHTRSPSDEMEIKMNHDDNSDSGYSTSSGRQSYKEVCSKEEEELIGFLETLQVITNSSAWNAGLRQGDIFLKFGPFTKFNFSGHLEDLWRYVDELDGKPVECFIGRRLTGSGGVATAPRMRVKKKLVIYPQKWTHGNVLGFVVNSYPPPSPVCD